jgi:Fic-DOC domain mobile mystery protein B
MGLDLNYHNGQTPLDEDEKDGLLIPTIATRQELDEFEQKNVEEAIEWTLKRKLKAEQVLTEDFIRKLHKLMYGYVWGWAGMFRKSNKNIGVDKWDIPSALKMLLDDTLYWLSNNTYPVEEIAIRFKHRLVSIHCFPNGNGRHSRLMADIILSTAAHGKVFTWAASSIVQAGTSRDEYIQALRAADEGDYEALLDFAKSA